MSTNNSNNNKEIPKVQRALIMQGGGSLGAYEAGVFRTLYKKISDIDKSKNKNRLLFDIITGTSIGAINGAIILSNYLKKGDWRDSIEKLEEYWNTIKTETLVEKTPGFEQYWDNLNNSSNGTIASGEAARRYYSAKQFVTYGAPNVFSSRFEAYNNKFLDYSARSGYRTSNDILGEFLEQEGFVKFPILTSFEKKEPRFLFTTIDVQSGKVVTFDSYNTEVHFWDKSKEIVIEYPRGIQREHLMTSAALPQNYDHLEFDDKNNPEKRVFWDGSFLSNTPLRELVQQHREYWKKRDPEKIPDLEVFIVGLWPRRLKDYPIPNDNDFTEDRKWDIIFHDKTLYDEKVINMITDYLDYIHKIKHLIDKRNDTELSKEIEDLDQEYTTSFKRSGKRRKYDDILQGRFRVYVHRIEREDDTKSISSKYYDFSKKTTEDLMSIGKKDGEEKVDWDLVEIISSCE